MFGVFILFLKKRLVWVAVVALFTMIVWRVNQKNWEPKNNPRVNLDILHQSEGVMGQVKVMDHGWKTESGKGIMARSLLVNNTWQTAVNRQNGNSILTYVYYMLPIIEKYPETSNMLVVGLGGGGLVGEMQRSGYKPYVVEIDKRLIDLSARFLA